MLFIIVWLSHIHNIRLAFLCFTYDEKTKTKSHTKTIYEDCVGYIIMAKIWDLFINNNFNLNLRRKFLEKLVLTLIFN